MIENYHDYLSIGLIFILLILLWVFRHNAAIQLQATRALIESEERYRLVANFTYDWETWQAEDGSYLYISPSCERITGYAAEEFLVDQRLMERIIHPEDPQHNCSRFDIPSPISAHSESIEFRIIRRDGEIRWIEHVCQPVHSKDGRFLGRRGSNHDITERKQAESELRKLSLAVEHSPSTIVITDLSGSIEFVNQRFIKATGYSREEALGKNPRILQSGQTHQHTYEGLWATLKQGQRWEGEFINRRKDGSTYLERALLSPVRNTEGQITHYMAIKEDITEHRRLELRLQAHNEALEALAKGATLTAVLNRIAEGIHQEQPEMICSILLLDKTGKRLLHGAAPDLPDFYLEAVDDVAIGDGIGSCGTAAYRNERVIVTDIDTHPYWQPFKALSARAGLRACWSEPIRSNDGNVLGVFALYQRVAKAPTAKDIALIESTTKLASIAIEHHRNREALFKSEEQYRLLVENVDEVVYSICANPSAEPNHHCEHSFVSNQIERILGVTPDEFTDYQRWLEKVHPDDRRSADIRHWKVIASSLRDLLEYRVWNEHLGGYSWVEERPTLKSHDDTLRIIGVMRDITPRKRVEEALRESEWRLRTALESANAGTYSLDLDLQYAKIDEHCQITYGIPAELHGNVTGIWADRLHPEDRERVKKQMAMDLNNPLVNDTVREFRVRDAQDKFRYISDSASIVRDMHGRAIRLAGMIYDLTERKQIEADLARQNQLLQQKNREIEEMARTDPLTGIANRRRLKERLQEEMARSVRRHLALSLILIDLDHFKSINDSCGHDVGDEALLLVAETMKTALRPYDLVARWGGEEFLILLPETDLANAREIAERIRQQLRLRVIARLGRAVTASFGVATLRSEDDMDRLVQRADEAMYNAKSGGRDRVEAKV